MAEVVEKKHYNLVRDISRYSKELTKLNFEFSDFFIESSYKDTSGKSNKCYLVTRKGCEFIANKLTGEKGTKFTATYINRFHEMEDALNGKTGPVLQEFMKQQTEAINAVVELVSQVMEGFKVLSSRNPFSVQQDVIDQRMRMLNDLVNQVSDLCSMDRNKVLHYLYKTLQEDLGVTLNPYLAVMKSEGADENACNLHVIASIDRFYEKAAEMCQDVIERKKLFG